MAAERHRATERILDIFECLLANEEGLTLTELSNHLEAPKSSLFPILHTMEDRRYLRLDKDSGRYFLGAASYVLGSAFNLEDRMDAIVHIMKEAVAACGETCQLGVLDHRKVLYIAKEDSTQAIRMISKVGNRLPANSTAIGKALLSGLSDEEVRQLYQDGMPKMTEHTIVDPEALIAQLQEVRRGNIAYENEESTAQLSCFALPIRRRGDVIAAISISLPLFRCTEEKQQIVEQCLREAQGEIEDFTEKWNLALL
jgi:IclR family KDG regulon transcriptional repressor